MLRLLKNSIILIFIIQSTAFNSFSQKSDVELINDIDFFDHHFDKRNVKFMLSGSKNPIIKYNPVSLSVGSMLYFYQGLISVQFSTNCMFNPSCSEFGVQVIKRYGIFKGIPLAADRLMRCNKLGAVDVHPLKIDLHNHKVIEDIDDYKNKKD